MESKDICMNPAKWHNRLCPECFYYKKCESKHREKYRGRK